MIELNLIKALLTKKTYETYREYVSFEDRELSQILSALDSYWLKFDNEPSIDDLELHFRASYPQLSEKKYAFYKTIFETLRLAEGKPEAIDSLLEALRKKTTLTKLAELALESREGNEDSFARLNVHYEELFSNQKEVQNEDALFVTTSLQKLKENTVDKPGLRWRLDILNKSLGSLRKGDFGFIFARPESGKTTFLASEVTFMAQTSDKPILWINNEEQGEKVMMKIYQSAFGIDKATLWANVEYYEQEFTKLVKGNLLMYDTAIITKTQIEKLCKKYQPSLIVIDQIDKIKGFAADRNDLTMGAIYQWARELSKTYAPVVGVCQADGQGEGVKWLTMSHVTDAKTAKQAEADWILGIGKTHDPEFAHKRYLNISKNKLDGDEDTVPEFRHHRCEVTIRPEIGRYED